MEKLTMCRICLAHDVRMHTIINTHLEDMYEKLSDKMFVTKDIRPVQACYICCARLQNCYQLKMNCLQSEELFTQILSSNMTPETTLLQIPVTKSLSVTPVTHLTTGVTIKKPIECDIKTEPPEVLYDVKVKMERSEGATLTDDQETSKDESDLLETDKNVQIIDKINDVPFIFIKLEPTDIVADAPDLEEANLEYLEELPSSKQEQIRVNNKNIKNDHKATINNQKQKSKNKRDPKLRENCQQCDVCKIKFNNILDFAKHDCLRIKLTCDICNKEFINNTSLGVHKRIHSGTKPYTCTICYKSFTDQSTIRRHMLVHTNEKPFKCGTCSKGFKRKSHLMTHILVHTNEKPYQCDVCKKCFSQKGHLHCHTKIHLGKKTNKPYICDICKKCYSDRSCIVRHIRRIHNLY